MAAGEWVETNAVSNARIIVGTLGTVDVAPGTRVQLGEVRDSEYRLALARGTIIAEINAPPRLFIVEHAGRCPRHRTSTLTWRSRTSRLLETLTRAVDIGFTGGADQP